MSDAGRYPTPEGGLEKARSEGREAENINDEQWQHERAWKFWSVATPFFIVAAWAVMAVVWGLISVGPESVFDPSASTLFFALIVVFPVTAVIAIVLVIATALRVRLRYRVWLAALAPPLT